jgi:hypothetical protein
VTLDTIFAKIQLGWGFDSAIQRGVGQRAEVGQKYKLITPRRFNMRMANPLIIPVTILLVGMALDSFARSATLSESRVESLLSAAGFQIRTGPDAERQMLYLRAAPNTLERHIDNGEVVYTYADPRGGFIYLGGRFEYQQFKRLLREASIAQSQVQTSEALDKPWRDWNWTWKPWKLWVGSYENFPND